MADRSSDHVLHQMRRVFNLGTVGMVSDAQLLDWFVSSKDESAEAAFEELMIRHGPMVFGICKSALRDAHDAQDAFQAVFMVLANRAGAIRRKHSVASWLFGVAQRVAARARNRAARRRSIDQRAAQQASECYVQVEHDPDGEVVHEELDQLPERLRAPVVLCYLEGLTYDAAARQLALSEGALRGRLSQARKRLRSQLSRRGITVPAALLAAGASTRVQAAVAGDLVHSTTQIALGLTADTAASVLARGVLKTMLLNQLKIVAGLVLVGTAAGLTAGLAWAFGPRPGVQTAGPEPAALAAATKTTASDKKVNVRQIQVKGVVVDEAGQPVAGAEVRVDAFGLRESRGDTAADGSFAIPVRHPEVNGLSLLARTPDQKRSGVFQYVFNLTREEAERPARVVVKPSREIMVHVTDSNKAPVPGAAVEVAGMLSVHDDATTGRDGSARLRVPADATVNWIIALKSGLGFDYAEFGLIDDQARSSQKGLPSGELPASVSLTLDGSRTVRIKAVDSAGNLLAGVAFTPWLIHKPGRRSDVNISTRIECATTGPDGVATFDWLPASNDALIFWPASEGYAFRRVELKEGASATVVAKLMRTEVIRGRVVYPDGQPAAGFEVHAFGSGQGVDNGQGRARTSQDGSYEIDVSPNEAYAVYVDDKDWAAPSHLDVVVRVGKPAGAVDFKLSRGTVIRGTVTVGPGHLPAPGQYISLAEAGGQAPEDLRVKGDRLWHQVRRQCGVMTDSAGHYSLRVGPGSYTLTGPPWKSGQEITVTDQAAVVRDFGMPRPEKGTLAGRVVISGADGKGVAGAKIEIIAQNQLAVPVAVTADALGRFHAERHLDPLVVHAETPDGKLAAIVEVGAQDAEIAISVAPTATATGILIDERKRPVANTPLDWGRPVFLDEERTISRTCFAPKVVTDSEGRFTLPALVVGQEYEISIRRDNTFPAAGAVRPEKAGTIELGTLQVGAYHPRSRARATKP